MQTQGDVDRIKDVGANPEITKFMGNLKFDIKPTLSQEEISQLAESLKLNGARLIVAASTHKGEDEIVLAAFSKVKTMDSNLKLLLAPRHPERYEQVTELLKKSGFAYGKRSQNDTFENND